MDLGIPPRHIKNLLESDPLKSRFLVRELTVWLITSGQASGDCSVVMPFSSQRKVWWRRARWTRASDVRFTKEEPRRSGVRPERAPTRKWRTSPVPRGAPHTPLFLAPARRPCSSSIFSARRPSWLEFAPRGAGRTGIFVLTEDSRVSISRNRIETVVKMCLRLRPYI